MQKTADLVIIGAGIVGSSCVYHLARKGWQKMVVVDQGPLFATGGSTSHAPGLVFQTSASRTMCQLSQYTVSLYNALEWEGEPGFHPVGGIEVAHTAERWRDLHRKQGLAQAWGLEGTALLSPAQVQERIPLLNPDVIHGGYYVPSDGIAKAVRLCTAMCKAAERAQAAVFYGNTTVTGFAIENGRVVGVHTDQGTIATERVLLCGGIWGPKIGALAGISVPLTPVEHQYVRTAPLPQLQHDAGKEVVHPILRHQDYALYYRQHGDAYGIGNYCHEPLLVEPNAILSPADAPVMPSVRDFTPEHFTVAQQATAELMPALNTVEHVSKINGMFSFTPDGNPVVGEAHVEGFWVAEAVWVTHGGGVGKVVADLLDRGVSDWDLRELDMHRFHAHVHTKPYIRARGAQQYREVYDIIHPKQQMEQPRPLRTTPFHERLAALDAHFFESAGWETPRWVGSNARLLEEYDIPDRAAWLDLDRTGTPWAARFWSPIEGAEHLATRAQAALYDISAFTKIRVEGPGAQGYLNYLAANQIDVPVGRVVYTAMLNAQGGIMCDLTITRLGPHAFLVLTGGGVGMHDLNWIRQNAPRDDRFGGSVVITDVSSAYATLGLWGPRARDILQAVTEDDVSHKAFGYFRAREIAIGYAPVLALRVSYVGELGWELYMPPEYAPRVWDALWQAGQPHGLIVGGGGAFDSLRLEKGYRLWGNELHSEYTPLEAGLEWAVKLDKGDFLGRAALLDQQQAGIQRKLCCITLDDPTHVLLGKEPIFAPDDDSLPVGYVSSAGYGYSIGRGIAYGYLPIELAAPGTQVTIHYLDAPVPATVQQEPLFDPDMTRLRG